MKKRIQFVSNSSSSSFVTVSNFVIINLNEKKLIKDVIEEQKESLINWLMEHEIPSIFAPSEVDSFIKSFDNNEFIDTNCGLLIDLEMSDDVYLGEEFRGSYDINLIAKLQNVCIDNNYITLKKGKYNE